jgi:hypothetical protein
MLIGGNMEQFITFLGSENFSINQASDKAMFASNNNHENDVKLPI